MSRLEGERERERERGGGEDRQTEKVLYRWLNHDADHTQVHTQNIKQFL